MKCEYADRFSVELCRANPNKLYVFGDNLARWGTAGQACIRREPNSFGVPTKRYPDTVAHAYFSDAKCERNHVLNALRELYVKSEYFTLVFPSAGIGTGLAKMPEKSPLIYAEMCGILLKHFGVKNGLG